MDVVKLPAKRNVSEFLEIPKSVRLAILLPTVRWSGYVQSAIGSLLGVANEEVAVLIGDNSENQVKSDFLKKISGINPNIYTISHRHNIGGFNNFMFLHDWF